MKKFAFCVFLAMMLAMILGTWLLVSGHEILAIEILATAIALVAVFRKRAEVAALIVLGTLLSAAQACPPSFQQIQVQQQTGCYNAPLQQLQAYVAPVQQYQSYAVQSYAVQPVVQRVVVQKHFVQPVRVQKVIVRQKAYGVQSFSAGPQIIQQQTIQRKGLLGLRKNVTNTTIINP